MTVRAAARRLGVPPAVRGADEFTLVHLHEPRCRSSAVRWWSKSPRTQAHGHTGTAALVALWAVQAVAGFLAADGDRRRHTQWRTDGTALCWPSAKWPL